MVFTKDSFYIRVKKIILKYRITVRLAILVTTALIGCWFFTIIIDLIYRLNNDVQLNERLAANIQMLVLSVPTLIALWVFRTNDTKEQIEKTKEQIEKTQTNINISILSKGIDLLHNKEGKSEASDSKKSSLGLVLLIKLKQDHPILADQINMATRNARLNSADLVGANLQKADLLGAELQKADLQEANLQGTYLQKADLREANLVLANLQGAYLLGANLQGTYLLGANLQGADLRGAEYNDATQFPDGFTNPVQHGMVKNP